MRPLIVIGLSLALTGCVSGIRDLGQSHHWDGSFTEYRQIGSAGQDGPKLVIIEACRTWPSRPWVSQCERLNASGESLTSSILRGAAGSLAIGGGIVGGAAVLRPARSTNTTGNTTGSVGCAANITESGAGSAVGC